jgi:anaerobic selenocysteine-containing dehydrogenase
VIAEEEIMTVETLTSTSKGMTRRSFLKWGTSAGAGLAAGSLFFVPSKSHAATYGNPIPPETDASVTIKYTVCQMCNSNCGLRVKINDVGRLIKVDGNPYHPNNTDTPLDYSTDPASPAGRAAVGRCCAKAQAAIETLYSPYRLKHPLKRVGRRGEGKWKRISWDEALSEIAAKLGAIRDLSTPMDPAAPELGPKANGLTFSGGRNQQPEFSDRFFEKCFGTINKRHDHTSICETSHHVAHAYLLDKSKNHLKPDINNCEYLIYFGTNPFEAAFPMVAIARKTQNMRTRQGNPGTMVVVDPRLSRTAGKADIWFPIKPGTDAALALAMGRRILDQQTYNANFLSFTSTAHAKNNGETIGSDATWLVNLNTRAFLTPAEAGVTAAAGSHVVIRQGGATSGDATADARGNDTEVQGELFVNATVNGIPVKSTLQLYRENCEAHTIAEWAAICGLDENQIIAVADSFTSHGRKAAATLYRGVCQHTNGTYASMAVIALNWLIGNLNYKGGLAGGGGGYHHMGEGAAGTLYDLKASSVRDAVSATGVDFCRIGKKYETSTEYANKPPGAKYPATRPWFPFAKNFNFQELFPSIGAQYPYPCQALITYWHAGIYSIPGHRQIAKEVLTDENKLPFFVAIDTEFGETSSLADILLPDVPFLEKFNAPGVAPTILTKVSGIRQPIVGFINGTPVHELPSMPAKATHRSIYPDCRMLEDILIEIGKAMGLPGFGANAFPDGYDFGGAGSGDLALDSAWDWYKRLYSNIAGDAGALVPGATELDKINYILARGGVMAAASTAYDSGNPDLLKSRFDKSEVHFYVEDFATGTDSMTGQKFQGSPNYEAIKTALDNPLGDNAGYPLKLLTYKPAWHAQGRTIINDTLRALQKENFVEISATDASTRGIVTGDLARLSSPSAPEGIVGRALVVEGMRPGVVAVAHSFGHWEMSSRPHTVNGASTGADAGRGAGIQANVVMENDPDLGKSVCLQDKIGGSASFYDSRVQVEKVS